MLSFCGLFNFSVQVEAKQQGIKSKHVPTRYIFVFPRNKAMLESLYEM